MPNQNHYTRPLKYALLAGMALLCQLLASPSVFGQLTLFANKGQAGPSGNCVVNTIYTDASIPGGLNNDISSIDLQQGYMATLAENSDGSGEAYTFIAAVSNITVDLNPLLDDKVSFIRVLPFRNTLKKGVGLQNNAHIDQLNVSWFYDWGALDVSLPGREYAMMSWGRQGANATNIANYINKPDVTQLLSFNEPDNVDQSNIPVAEAVTLHKNLAQTGLRLGSPAPTESQAFVWLTDFMAGTRQQKIKVDYVAVHWYDWSSYLSTGNTAPDPNSVFTRFKNYINYVYAVYGKPIWITEFNANRNTTSATHEQFIALALPWLEAQPFVERYAYFFPPALPPVDGSGNITAIGRAYRDFAGSTAAITKNYDNTELFTADVNSVKEGENAILYNPSVSNTTPTCATASGGLMVAAVTGSSRIGFHEINVPVAGNYKVEVSYFAKTARNMTTRVNHGTPQVTALPASGNWCFEGGSPGLFEITVSLLAGNNSIEFTESPIIDFVKVKDNGVLPVSLLNFSGKLVNKLAELEWRTAQEQNSQHFDVLRSTDGNRFAYVGRVQAAGNSATANNYAFTDRNPSGVMTFYKLKAVDKDGGFTYSNTIAIKNDSRTAALSFLSATSQCIRISAYSTTNEMATANLISVDGKVLATQKLLLKTGLNVFEIPNRISKGSIGLITLHSSNATNSIKFMQ
jgi:hypothetical protein